MKTNLFEESVQYCPIMHILDSKLGLSSVQWLTALLDNWTGRRDQDHMISGDCTNIRSDPLFHPMLRILPYVQMSNRGKGIVQVPCGLDGTRRVVKLVVQSPLERPFTSYEPPQNRGLLILSSGEMGETTGLLRLVRFEHAMPYPPLQATPKEYAPF